MSRYNDLVDVLNQKELKNTLEELSDAQVEKERKENPLVPGEYLDFLKEIGYGNIGNDGYFMFYSGLVPASDIYGDSNELQDIWLLGDDFSGYCIGFLSSDCWKLVEVDSFRQIEYLDISFEKFVREKIMTYISSII